CPDRPHPNLPGPDPYRDRSPLDGRSQEGPDPGDLQRGGPLLAGDRPGQAAVAGSDQLCAAGLGCENKSTDLRPQEGPADAASLPAVRSIRLAVSVAGSQLGLAEYPPGAFPGSGGLL